MEQVMSYCIKTGHARFRTVVCKDGSFELQVYCSDVKVPIGVDLTKEELWDNQNVVPVFAIKFESIEQLKAYIKVFNDSLEIVKNIFATMNMEQEVGT